MLIFPVLKVRKQQPEIVISARMLIFLRPRWLPTECVGSRKDVLIIPTPAIILLIFKLTDTAFGAGVVSASLDGTGLKLTTVATGHEEYIEVVSDGQGAKAAAC